MTVIVCNRECMAADTQVTGQNGEKHHTKKIFRVGDDLVGIAGDSKACDKYLKWREGGCIGRPPGLKKIEVLILNKSGIYQHYYATGLEPVLGDYAAAGVGGAVALGAMESGSTVEQAVLAACKHNALCGCHDKPQVEYL